MIRKRDLQEAINDLGKDIVSLAIRISNLEDDIKPREKKRGRGRPRKQQ